jgi:glycosyltransferase involved in cell wall biosynthesis
LDLKIHFAIILNMTSDKIRILHISVNKEKGGRSSYSVDLVKSLNRGLCENFLITTVGSEINELAELRRVNLESSKKLSVTKILKYAEEIDAKILHFHDNDSYCFIPSEGTASKKGMRIVVDLHMYDWRKKHFPRQHNLKNADILIASTIKEKNFTHDIPFSVDRVVVVHKPVNVVRFNQTISPRPILAAFNVPPEIMLVGTVARLDQTMNYQLWIDTIRMIVNKYPDIEFLIVGDGNQKSFFENKLKQNGLNNKTMFTGFRSDIPQVLAAMDIYFHPTFEDQVPYSVLEAMAVGKPVVSPNLSSIREMFINERNGMFYDIESPVSAFNLISMFKENPATQAEIVKNNIKDTSEKYSINHASEMVYHIYQKLLKK